MRYSSGPSTVSATLSAGSASFERRGASGRTTGVSLFRFDDHGTEFAWGAGAQLNFGSLSARLEYDNFDIDNTDGAELYTLGVTWTFL